MVTASIAQSYMRDCFAFPGRVNDQFSMGCNELIARNKAALITSAYDFVEAMADYADALDGKIGDVRDTTDVLLSAGREYLGGQGNVSYVTQLPRISDTIINQDVFVPENEGNLWLDIRTVKDYLSGLQRQQDVAKKMQESQKSSA